MSNKTVYDEIYEAFFGKQYASSVPSYVYKSDRTRVYYTDDSAVQEIDLPGVKKEDISVSIDGDYLVVKADRKEPETPKGASVIVKNSSIGEFKQSYKIGKELDTDTIDASYENGVLTVKCKKKKESLPRNITIK